MTNKVFSRASKICFSLVAGLFAVDSAIAQDTLTIAMVGDVMMGTTFPSMMLPDNEGRDLFRDAAGILKRADLTVGNLEGTLCDGGQSTKGSRPSSYKSARPCRRRRLPVLPTR